MDKVLIRQARPDDAVMLGAVGPAAYIETYSYSWDDPAALARHLVTFGESAWRKVLADPDMRVWVAETGGEPAGFLSLILDSNDPVTRAAGGAQIPRVYILGAARGRRFGEKLFNAARETAQHEGAAYLWLGVMSTAPWAARSYAAWGFEEIGREQFPRKVKDGHADMIIMKRAL